MPVEKGTLTSQENAHRALPVQEHAGSISRHLPVATRALNLAALPGQEAAGSSSRPQPIAKRALKLVLPVQGEAGSSSRSTLAGAHLLA